jgi:hypothetical protein
LDRATLSGITEMSHDVGQTADLAHLGVPELWLTDGESVRILRLDSGEYKPVRQSSTSPALTEAVLSDFLRRSQSLTTLAWRKPVRDWARDQGKSADLA